jgi:two-component system, LuxR family, sensor kinase FixL
MSAATTAPYPAPRPSRHSSAQDPALAGETAPRPLTSGTATASTAITFAAALATTGPVRLARLLRRHTAGALVSVLTHELSQPLSAIGMYSSAAARMVEMGRADAADLAQVLRQIETQVQRAGDLLSRVRALTRPAEPPATAADLGRCTTDAVAMIAPLASAKRIEVSLEAPEQSVPVAAEPSQVTQAVLTLLFNALEAIEEADPPERQVSVAVRTAPDGGLVRVQDSGPGLGPEGFERACAALPSGKPQGCGLGLAISRALVEVQGGDIWADSGAGGGATLNLRLPTVPASALQDPDGTG